MFFVAGTLLVVGCGPGVPGNPEIDANDAKPPMDAITDTKPPLDTPPPTPTTHLLITEIALRPTEFIEIFNPGKDPVDLSNYYLADRPGYELFPGALGAGPAPITPTAASSPFVNDFIARFPAGAIIGPGEVKVITIVDAGIADFVVAGATGPKAMRDLANPQYIPIASSFGSGGLTNGGEGIVLFFWDGQSDLVQDVDMVATTTGTTSNLFTAKSSQVAVDGPDPGATPTGYKTDALTMKNIPTAPGTDGQSQKRIALEEGAEVHNGNGNGIIGHDETTEDLTVTWDMTFTDATPGTVPSELMQTTP